MKTTIYELITKHSPCRDGLEFAQSCNGDFVKIWNECERGDWLIWLLRKYKLLNKEQSVKIAIACAEPALKIFEEKHPNDFRPRKAIESAKAWLDKPTKENAAYSAAAYSAAASSAAAAASSAAYAAYAASNAAASSAAAAASSAAYADDDAAYAAYAASNAAASSAAAAAASSAAYAAYSAAKLNCRKEQAKIIRSIITNPFEN